jgi:hypothetical protein
MNLVYDDTISELEAVTAEMAALQDLGDERLHNLLERRGMLIQSLIGTDWDASDERLASIIANAAELQERLQKHAESIRGDLSRLESAGALVSAVRSTFGRHQANGVDISG